MAPDRVNGTPRALAALATLAALAACAPLGRRMTAEGLPVAPTYLGSSTRAPSAEERVDSAPTQRWRARVGRGTVGLPAVGERVTVLATVDRWVYAIETETGRTIWRRRGDTPYGAGPVVAEGLVVTAGEGLTARVTAMRLRDGRRRWSVRMGDVTAPLALAGGQVYGVTTAGIAFALRTADGSVAWRRDVGATRAAPVVVGGRVVIVTVTDTLTVLDTARGTVERRATLPTSTIAPPTVLDDSTIAIADPAGGVLAIAVPGGAVRWRVATGAPVLGAVALARDTVFALATTCTLWRIPLAAPAAADSLTIPDCVTEAGPTVLRDGVLVASVRGEVILYDPSDRRRVFTRTVRGPLQQPAQVVRGQILIAPSIGEVVSFR